jgi:hypothetical protein
MKLDASLRILLLPYFLLMRFIRKLGAYFPIGGFYTNGLIELLFERRGFIRKRKRIHTFC